MTFDWMKMLPLLKLDLIVLPLALKFPVTFESMQQHSWNAGKWLPPRDILEVELLLQGNSLHSTTPVVYLQYNANNINNK